METTTAGCEVKGWDGVQAMWGESVSVTGRKRGPFQGEGGVSNESLNAAGRNSSLRSPVFRSSDLELVYVLGDETEAGSLGSTASVGGRDSSLGVSEVQYILRSLVVRFFCLKMVHSLGRQ